MKLRHFESLGLFCVFFGLYGFTRSPYLDDWDSINFAFALNEFDPAAGKPHPPGYPLYVFIARAIHTVVQEPTKSLTLLSAVAGALNVVLVLLIARKFLSAAHALLAASFLGFIPVYWLESLKALTDQPGLCVTLGVLLAVDSSRRNLQIAGPFLAGLGAGIRPHSLAATLPILVYYLRRRSQGPRIYSIIAAWVVGIASWWVPTQWILGGGAFIDANAKMFFARFSRPDISLLAAPPSVSGVWEHLSKIAHTFVAGGLGLSGNRWLEWGVVGALLIAGSTTLRFEKTSREPVLAALLLGNAGHFVMVLLLLPPQNVRYLLPLSVLLALAFGCAQEMIRSRAVRWGVAVIGAASVLYSSVSLVRGLVTIPPASIQLIDYINQTLSNQDNRVFVYHSRYLDYYPIALTAIDQKRVRYAQVRQLLLSGVEVYMDVRPRCPAVRMVPIAQFNRDERIHSKSHHTEIIRIDSVGDCQ